jgi:hypothetical protein
MNAETKPPKRTITVHVDEVSTFSRSIRIAFDEMERRGLDELAIPEASGMVLVRKGSEAEKTHQKPGNVLYERQIEGKGFLVCLS